MATAFKQVRATSARKPFKPRIVADNTPREDVYAEVTRKIVAQLREGVCPWARPWSVGQSSPTMPQNHATGRRYSGVNILLLWTAQMEKAFSSSQWLTYKQAEALGGNVRKGERGTMIVYADTFVPEAEKARAARDGDQERAVPFMKRHTVFNIAQCDGLDAVEPVEPLGEHDCIAAARRLIDATGADFRIGGGEAFYSPSHDFISVPDPRAFHNMVNWNRTALHECTHWTGHKSRLDRNFTNAFGSKEYAKEELVAEMGSAFLCASLGIVPTVRHADYLGAWIKVLDDDHRFIFKAASAATKATDFLLAFLDKSEG